MPIPALFTSPRVSRDLTRFGPDHWNTVTALLRGLFDGAEADGTVLTRSAASATGAAWSAASSGLPTGVAAGSVLVSNGVGVAPVFSAAPALTDLTLTGRLKLTSGTAGAPGFVFTDDLTTGFYKSATTILDLSIAGTQAFRFSANGLFFTSSAGKFVLSSGGALSFSAAVAGSAAEDLYLRRVAAGQLILTNAAPLGIGVDVNTDAVLKVRTRAHTGYGTVDCLGLKASGVAGATFGPGAPTSITVVNGIVTACS